MVIMISIAYRSDIRQTPSCMQLCRYPCRSPQLSRRRLAALGCFLLPPTPAIGRPDHRYRYHMGFLETRRKRRGHTSKIISSLDTRQITLTLQMASFNDQRRPYPSRATSTVAGLSKSLSLASRAVKMPQYMTREGGDPTQIKRSKQGMADLKLRRLMELNNRLREDLDRERIPVSTASKR